MCRNRQATTMWFLSRCGAVVPLFLYLLHSVSGNYVITWPKSWFAGTPVQFCIAQDPFSSLDDLISVQVWVPKNQVEYPTFPEFDYKGGTAYLPPEIIDRLDLQPETEEVILQEQLRPTVGSKLSCVSLLPPDNLASYWNARVRVYGTLSGVAIDESRMIVAQDVRQIFIQTDKERYKPGQKVQFRVLTLETPDMRVLTEPYSAIHVEDPEGTRIKQWLDVPNPSGLIHLDFQLYDELLEGSYTIYVSSENGGQTKRFLVEEYVLPRFEITLKAPGYVLASDETLELEVCAQYTFGEPVRGTLAINIRNGRHDSMWRVVNFEDEIVGCRTAQISLNSLAIGKEFEPKVNGLSAYIAVTEEGTDVVASESLYIDVSRTALRFEQDWPNYPKPELPYFSSVRATFNDGSPAGNETLTVCSKRWVLPSVVQSMRQSTGCFTTTPSNNQDSPMTLCPEVVCKYLGANNYGIPVAACFVAICRNMTTDDSGVVRVTIPPHLFSDPLVEALVEVRAANYPDLFVVGSRIEKYMQMPITQLYIGRKRYFSPSNSSLFINPDKLKLDCTAGSNIDLQLPVMYAAKGPVQVTLYVQVVARGQIQLTKTFSVSLSRSNIEFDDETLVEQMVPFWSIFTRRGVLTLPLTLPPTVSPVVRVLIWYVRSDGEVVSDEQPLEISRCLNHSVEMSWPRDRVEFGEEVPLTLEAEPNALCSVGVVDRSVELLSSTQTSQLIDEVFLLARSAAYTNYVKQTNDFEHCVKRSCQDDVLGADRSGEQRAQMPELRLIGSETTSAQTSFSFYSEFVDAIQMFDDAGLFVISDLTLETRPCKRGAYVSDNYGCGFGGLLGNALLGGDSGGMVGGMLAGGAGPEMGGGLPVGGGDAGGESASSGPITPAIEVITRTYFPETWLWELQTIPASGVFSENRTLPDTITEWVGRAVCVHPDKGIGISAPTSITTFTSFFIDLTLPPSVKVGEILPVKISVFNYLDTPMSVRITLEESPEYEILEGNTTEAATNQATAGQRSACVPAQDKETVVVRIRFLESSTGNITVSAETVPGLVNNCDSGTESEKRDRIITPIAVDYEGFIRETFYSLYYCTGSATNYNGWTLAVPPKTNIVSNSARSWITATGELIGPNLENLDWLIRMPYACGEQNLATFAPNIYVLKYLQRTQQYNATVAAKLIEYMKRGYQQQLNYQRTDGSYSVWGGRDQYGSTWLTAFVVKTYARAEEFIDISSSRITRPLSWLMNLQLQSGCFQLVGHVHNRRMKGGLGEGSAPGALTAYVMAALLEAGTPPDLPEITQATTCIEDATAPGAIGENDVYLLALKAYAFSLAGLNQTTAVIDDLFTRAEENSDGTYWKIESHSGWYSEALSVETTSYVLLAILTSDYPDPQSRKLRVLKWILSRRNGRGGFVSTQDTVVGLQALALFGSPVPDEPFDAAVSFTTSDIMETLQVTEDNKLLLQRFDVETLPAQIDVEFSGEGCIFVEGVVRYNVPDPDLSEVFSVRVSTSIDYSAAVCQTNVIKVCATYSATNVESNMGIIEVNLVSGYLPDTQSLDRIVSDVTGVIKRYDVDGSQVIFYIDKFTDSQICVQFVAYEEAEVEMTSPGTVRVYDYYEPEFYVNEVFQFRRRYCP